MKSVKTYISTFRDFVEYSGVTMEQIEKDWEIPAKTLNRWYEGSHCVSWTIRMLIQLYDVGNIVEFVPPGSAIII